MFNCFISEAQGRVIPIEPICKDDFVTWVASQVDRVKNIIAANKFSAEQSSYCLVLDQDGVIEKVLLGIATQDDFLTFGMLPKVLPAGIYEIVATDFSLDQLERAAIGWGRGSYRFKRYKNLKDFPAVLLCKNYNINRINKSIAATFLVRDLINTPACDLYPEKLVDVATSLANKFKADLNVIQGEDLISGFPAVYAVGRGSEKQPVLIDLHYGNSKNPKVVLVGKGVCFDSGGIQLKSASGLLLMKKDMAGAAHVLALAEMIIEAKLPINLRVIIPVVENLISGDAYKTGDIIRTRQGLTLEVANTDAEGRLILADALTLASEWRPELIVDFATLTTAARVALGADITALFTNNDRIAQDIIATMEEEQDYIWRLPLHQPYLASLKSEIADFKNIATSDDVKAGAIISALLLQQFVAPGIQWAHLDINAYNATTKPGKPEGGEASCLSGMFKYIEQRFCV